MNKNNSIVIIIIIVLALLVCIFGLYFINKHIANSPSANLPNISKNIKTQSVSKKNVVTSKNIVQNQVKGTMYFTIADAETAYMGELANVSSVSVTIDKVQAYNEASGWITLSQTSQTFDLAQLKSNNQVLLLAKAAVPANKYPVPENTYDEFRLHIAKVVATVSGVTKTAILPSNDFIVKTTGLIVYANNSSAAQFNILAIKSLHQTDKGEFVFTPVATFDSRDNATVQVAKNGVTSASFGETNPSFNFGMDIDGKIKSDFFVDPGAKLVINSGVIQISNQ